MSVLYKILCEIKWLHEYYLTTDKGETAFDHAAQNDRMNFVFNRFVKDEPSINETLEFLEPEMQRSLYVDHKLKIIPAYSGFKIAVKCKKITLGDGTVVYEPAIPFPDDLIIPVLIHEISTLGPFSQYKLNSPFQAAWFFSSDNIPQPKTFPFLASQVPAFNGGAAYEQGELASYAANDIRSFQNNGAVDPWLKLNGTGYAGESDRWLLPLAFPYHFAESDAITDATFSLKDATNTEVKKITFTDTKPFKSLVLNFHTDNNLVKTIPESPPGPAGFYKLDVNGNNGYAKSFTPILFASDALDISRYAGLVHIKHNPANAAFKLLDSNGYLTTRILPDTSRVPPPIFEIWMKSRLVFWQYRNNKQRKIKTTLDTQDVLADQGGILEGKNPYRLSHSPLMIKKPDNSFLYLPNPNPGDTIRISGNKFYIPIQVPESKMFPLA